MKIVMKFGGTSIADIDKIKNVAQIIKNQYMTDNIAVVVSAMGKKTNALDNLAHQITDNPNPRELDAVLATGECVSAGLVAIALNSLGCMAISYNALQLGIVTDENFGNACIKRINAPLSSLVDNRIIPVITGFQGVTYNNDITTLGREGSDTSAVAIAAAINANYCDIYTDVDGVYTADPRVDKGAKKIDFITYDDMLKMANNGAKVLHPRSVQTAKDNNIQIRVRSTFKPEDLGTLVARMRQR